MFVKKFEADTIDEALRAVKKELGPDAIILKTVTNKGFKGAFRKKRIEITAAISERNFENKSKVDKVLDSEQKNDFYRRGAGDIKQAIDGYAQKREGQAAGYGQLGLNKMVNQISRGTEGLTEAARKTSQALKSSLDDFLSEEEEEAFEEDAIDQELLQRPARPAPRAASVAPQSAGQRPQRPVAAEAAPTPAPAPLSAQARELINELRQELRTQQNRIGVLEQKLHELALNPVATGPQDATGLQQLRTTLTALDVDEGAVLELIRKAAYELSKDDLANADAVFEFALKEMTTTIHTALPLFSTVEEEPVITVLLSEAASGQTSMAMKIAILKKDVEVIQYAAEGGHGGSGADFAAQVFGLPIHRAQTPAEVIQLCRKALENGKSCIVDLRLASKQSDETRKFVEALRRGFNRVEVLVTLSAIHSELHNRKILSRYKDFTDGLIISHVDLCPNFGALYNVHRAHAKIPLKFFGTGPVVPDDIESATAERIMAGLFQLA